jgi:cytochrome P450/NADPH-cytochrome P450 reductase
VCSSYLAERPRGSSVWAFVRDTGSSFRPPRNPRTPMILVGPGTGIAPFRGFLQDRLDLQEGGVQVGRSLLFFGCRHPDHDFLYRDELRAFADAGVTQLVCAFSRLDGTDEQEQRGPGNVYVQHQIAALAEVVWELLEEGAVVYVCGAAQMASEVGRAFCEVRRSKAGGDAADAERWLAGLQEARRYLVDVWASG